MAKLCVDCGSPHISERRRCRQCALLYNRIRAKKYHRKDKPRYGVINCEICGEPMIKNHPNQTYHGKCRKNLKTIDNYNMVKRTKDGKSTLGRKVILDLNFQLKRNNIVHHIDLNPNNNTLTNLMILNQSLHAKLHTHLNQKWWLLSKDDSIDLENCWDTLRDQLTTTWLETAGVNVVKIVDIGQSAAEPLNSNFIYIFEQEEGSETMYQEPK